MQPNIPTTPPLETPNVRTQADVDAELESIQSLIDDGLYTADPPGEPAASTPGTPASPALVDEAAAGSKGWVPKEAYKGDPAKWVDAKTFLARGERFASNLQKELAEVRAQLASFEGTKTAFIKFHEETVAKKDSDLRDAISALRVQRSQATADGEHNTAVELEDRIELLRDQQKELKATAVPAQAPAPTYNGPDMSNPVMLDWIDDGNTWFRDEPELQKYAIEIGNTLRGQGNKLMGRAFLNAISEQVQSDFPRRFRESGRPQAGNVAGGGNSNGNAGVKGYNGKTERDLPTEDLRLMKEFIAEGYTTKEKFLTSYFARTK